MTKHLNFSKITLTERTATIFSKIVLIPFGVGLVSLIAYCCIRTPFLDTVSELCMYPFVIATILMVAFGGTLMTMMKDAEVANGITNRETIKSMNAAARGINSVAGFVILCIILNHSLSAEVSEAYIFYLLIGKIIGGYILSFVYGPIMESLISKVVQIKI